MFINYCSRFIFIHGYEFVGNLRVLDSCSRISLGAALILRYFRICEFVSFPSPFSISSYTVLAVQTLKCNIAPCNPCTILQKIICQFSTRVAVGNTPIAKLSMDEFLRWHSLQAVRASWNECNWKTFQFRRSETLQTSWVMVTYTSWKHLSIW